MGLGSGSQAMRSGSTVKANISIWDQKHFWDHRLKYEIFGITI